MALGAQIVGGRRNRRFALVRTGGDWVKAPVDVVLPPFPEDAVESDGGAEFVDDPDIADGPGQVRWATERQVAYLRDLAGDVVVEFGGRMVPLDQSLTLEEASQLLEWLGAPSRKVGGWGPATERQVAALRNLMGDQMAEAVEWDGETIPFADLSVLDANLLIDALLGIKKKVWRSYVRNEDLPVPNPAATENPLKGQVVVFTGELPNRMRRKEAWEIVATLGGQPKQNVIKATTMLVVGEWLPYTLRPDRPHSEKYEKVMNMRRDNPESVTVIDGDTFMEYAVHAKGQHNGH